MSSNWKNGNLQALYHHHPHRLQAQTLPQVVETVMEHAFRQDLPLAQIPLAQVQNVVDPQVALKNLLLVPWGL